MMIQAPTNCPSLTELFPVSSRPLELEIGCGKGKFLVARAEQCPEINFLGIDRIFKWMKRSMKRVEKQAMSNIKFLKIEARDFLTSHLPKESVRTVHIYFPDPWPKRKHRKRRLVQEPLLGLVYEVLEHDGLLEIVTDDEDYFREMLHSVRDGNLLWRDIRESLDGRLFEAVTKTNYELRYESQGKTIYSLEAKK